MNLFYLRRHHVANPIAEQRKIRGRVVGGSNVLSDTEFPMFASLIKEGGDEPFCGATILDQTHVITAAHCDAKEGTIVRWGTTDRLLKDDHEKSKVVRVANHPKMKKEYGHTIYDFAILTLEKPIFFGDRKAVPAAIATLEEFQTRDPKAACIMVGNGITGEMGAKIYKETTQKGEQLITDKFGCKEFIRHYNEQGHCFVTEPKNLLGGRGVKKGARACNGDSGGPLFCEVNGSYKLFGVAGWATRSCDSVAGWWAPHSVIDWIMEEEHDVKLTEKGHMITGIELVLAMLVSILVTAGVAFGVFICWRFKMKRKNENLNKDRPLPETPEENPLLESDTYQSNEYGSN